MNPKDKVGAKKAPLRYVPRALDIEVSAVMETGATKYGPFNWRQQPVSAVTYAEAMLRHIYAWLEGQDNAEDSGLNHIAHVGASAGIILDALASGTMLDDRTIGPAADILRRLDKSQLPAPAHEPVVLKRPEPEPGVRFLCGHAYGEEPVTEIPGNCGTAVHWSRVNGVVLMPDELSAPEYAELKQDCNCPSDWTEHAMECPLFHLGRS